MKEETKHQRLKAWIATLNQDQKDEIILELTDFAIDAEHVCFWDDSKKPYYDGSGENLDGTITFEEQY